MLTYHREEGQNQIVNVELSQGVQNQVDVDQSHEERERERQKDDSTIN